MVIWRRTQHRVLRLFHHDKGEKMTIIYGSIIEACVSCVLLAWERFADSLAAFEIGISETSCYTMAKDAVAKDADIGEEVISLSRPCVC